MNYTQTEQKILAALEQGDQSRADLRATIGCQYSELPTIIENLQRKLRNDPEERRRIDRLHGEDGITFRLSERVIVPLQVTGWQHPVLRIAK